MAAKREIKPIQYFVFMKAETTGRQWEDFEPTKIVELSFIAVNRRDLERGEPKIMPAALKMNMVLCPERYIKEEATGAHDLTESYVQNALTFNQCAGIIVPFLQQLPKPVCLIAHNGVSFDYKHLKSECNSAGVSLPEDLLCADSMWIFYHILKGEYEKMKNLNPQQLYQILFNEVIEPTTAEEKALMTLDCALIRKEDFLQLADKKCKLFSEVLAVGERRSLGE